MINRLSLIALLTLSTAAIADKPVPGGAVPALRFPPHGWRL